MAESQEQADEAPVDDQPGWRVLDADGTVVSSGPGIVLESAAHTGEEQ